MRYASAEESRQADVTYHLVPEEIWEKSRSSKSYVPEAYHSDGFIHCTNGLDPLLDVGNHFYRTDHREYKVLILQTSQIGAEVRYEDKDQVFPHIYGSLNTDAVIGELTAMRANDGTFAGFEEH